MRAGQPRLHRAAVGGADIVATMLQGRRWLFCPLCGPRGRVVHASAEAEVKAMWVERAEWCLKPSRVRLEQFQRSLLPGALWLQGGAAAEQAPEADEGLPRALVLPAPRRRHALLSRGVCSVAYDVDFLVGVALFGGYLRNVRRMGEAAAAGFNLIFGEDAPRLWAELQAGTLRLPAASVQYGLRTRLDACCMLLQRRRRPPRGTGEVVSVELLVDASRAFGREVLAMREAVVLHSLDSPVPRVQQRRLPSVGMAHRHVSVYDKCMAMLHILRLEHGPGLAQVRGWLGLVTAVATDLGVETGLAEAMDVVPEYFGVVDAAAGSRHLLPRALRVAGWNHVWHTIMENVAAAAWPWYPAWAAQFSAVAEWATVAAHREKLDEWLDASGGGLSVCQRLACAR